MEKPPYLLVLNPGYSRLDFLAENYIKGQKKTQHATLKAARRALSKINKMLIRLLGKREALPRIDILDSAGKRYNWGG